MITFRWYRGSFEESIKTKQEFESVFDALSMLRNYHLQDTEFKISFYAYDDRTKEDLFSVKTHSMFIIGFIGVKPDTDTTLYDIKRFDPYFPGPTNQIVSDLTLSNIMAQAKELNINVTVAKNHVAQSIIFDITGPKPNRLTMIELLEHFRPYGIPFEYREHDEGG